jgi:hypothetical protein
MATIKFFEDLNVWQRARVFSRNVYQLTTKGSFSKDWALRDQINKSTGSVMDNIAEGFERGGNKEFVTFLSYAKVRQESQDRSFIAPWTANTLPSPRLRNSSRNLVK